MPGLAPSPLLLEFTLSLEPRDSSVHSLNKAERAGTYVMLMGVIPGPAPASLPFPGNTEHHNEHGAV